MQKEGRAPSSCTGGEQRQLLEWHGSTHTPLIDDSEGMALGGLESRLDAMLRSDGERVSTADLRGTAKASSSNI